MLQTYFSKFKLQTGLLQLFCGGTFWVTCLSAQAEVVRCSDMQGFKISYFNLVAEQKNYRHSARMIGAEINQENMRRSILELAGRFPIDNEGCIGDRCTNKNKDRYVAYLQQRVTSMGIHNYLEVGDRPYSAYSFGKKKKGAVNKNPGAGPLDFAEADRHFVQTLFSTKRTKLAGRFIRELGLNFDRGEYDKIDVKFLEAVIQVMKTSAPNPAPVAKFGLRPSIEELSKLEFFKNGRMRLDTIVQLEGIRDRVKSGNSAREEEFEKKVESLNPGRRPDIINVIAEIPGRSRPQDIIEVSAHYDSIAPDHPGADDNGSGLATMLEMMRVFKRFQPEKTIRFVFTDLEERGMQGSRLHVEKVIQRGDRIYGALLIDTIGYHPLRESGEKPVFVVELGTRGMRGSQTQYDLAAEFTDVIAWQFARYERYVRMSVETFGAKPGTADHASYFEAGLPGILAAAPYEGDFINPGYHNRGDIIEQYNWLYFMSIARALTEGVAVAAESKVTPADVKKLQPEVIAYFDGEYKNASPQTNHKSEISNKGGKTYSSSSYRSSGPMFGEGSRKGPSSSSGPTGPSYKDSDFGGFY